MSFISRGDEQYEKMGMEEICCYGADSRIVFSGHCICRGDSDIG